MTKAFVDLEVETKTQKPAWWQLFVLVPLMFGLMVVEHLTPLPGISDEIVDVGIVAFTFVAMIGWVQVNGGVLERYEIDRDKSLDDLKITVYEPVSRMDAQVETSPDASPTRKTLSGVRVQGDPRRHIEEKDIWFLN